MANKTHQVDETVVVDKRKTGVVGVIECVRQPDGAIEPTSWIIGNSEHYQHTALIAVSGEAARIWRDWKIEGVANVFNALGSPAIYCRRSAPWKRGRCRTSKTVRATS